MPTRADDSLRTVTVALVTNLVTALAKVLVALFIGSSAMQLDHLPNAWINQALLHGPTAQPRDSFTRWVAPVESQVLDKLNRAHGQQEHQYNT
jgi:hypothetical protein